MAVNIILNRCNEQKVVYAPYFQRDISAIAERRPFWMLKAKILPLLTNMANQSVGTEGLFYDT